MASAQAMRASSLLLGGRKEEALTAAQSEPDEGWKLGVLPIVLWELGRQTESDAALSTLTDKYASGSAYEIAQIHAYRHETDLAFKWLDRAIRQHDYAVPWVKADPFLRNINSDYRYRQLLSKLKLAPAS